MFQNAFCLLKIIPFCRFLQSFSTTKKFTLNIAVADADDDDDEEWNRHCTAGDPQETKCLMLIDAWGIGSSTVSGENWWYGRHWSSLSEHRIVPSLCCNWYGLERLCMTTRVRAMQGFKTLNDATGWKRVYMDDLLDRFCGYQTDGMYCFLHWIGCFL